jgi:hypothetical protein
MKIFNSIGHFFAWVLGKIVPAAQAVEQAAGSPLGQALAGLLGSKGQAVQDAIQAIAGDVLNAYQAAGAAIGSAGLNVSFDQATVQAIELLYHDLAAVFGKTPAPAPVGGK